MEVAFGRPSSTDHLPTIAKELDLLVAGSRAHVGYGYVVETERINTRLGEQTFPARVFFPDEENYLRFIGKNHEVESLRSAVGETASRVPEILAWVHEYPMRLVEHGNEWSDILTIARCLIDRPRPGCFPRELPIEVSGKLLGTRQRLIMEMLRDVPGLLDPLGKEPLDALGLRSPEPLIEIRFLTAEVAQRSGVPVQYLAITTSSLARLIPAAHSIFILENRMSFLSFPSVPQAVAIWGQGNSATVLSKISWLAEKDVYYAGDIDASGFEILSRFRRHFPNVRSMLMDATTYERGIESRLRTTAPETASPPFDNLTAEERLVALHVHQKRIQLEQEKFPLAWLTDWLSAKQLISRV